MFHLITHVQFVSVCMLRSVWITQPPSLSSFSCIMWNVLNNWKWKLKTRNLFRGCFFWFWPYHIETPLYSIDIDIISNENFVYRYTLPTSDLNLFEIWEHIAWKATLFRIFGRNQKQSETLKPKSAWPHFTFCPLLRFQHSVVLEFQSSLNSKYIPNVQKMTIVNVCFEIGRKCPKRRLTLGWPCGYYTAFMLQWGKDCNSHFSTWGQIFYMKRLTSFWLHEHMCPNLNFSL